MNNEEWDLLWGLPHEAQLLYGAIRRRRDYSSGITGVKTTLSWNALTEDLEVPSTPGRKSYRPTQNKLRHYADLLIKRGLLESLTNKTERKLIFSCPLAKRHQSVSERFNRSSTDNSNIPEHVAMPEVPTVPEDLTTEVEHTENQEVQHTSLYHQKNVCLCVTDYREQFFLEFQHLVNAKKISETELRHDIDDYLDFTAAKKTRPNRKGLEKLLEARIYYRRQSKGKSQAIDELRQAEVEKFNALAEREQQKADHIASETIYRQRNPMRH